MKTVLRWGWSLGLILGLLACAPGGATALVGQNEDNGQKIYKQTLKGTVWILRLAEQGVITGSGVFVHRDSKFGYLITNYHVVGEATEVRLFFPVANNKGEIIADRNSYIQMMRNNRHIDGVVIHRKRSSDLAVIKIASGQIPKSAKVVSLAKESPKPADEVHSIGSPGAVGALWIYTPGRVRQVYKAELRSKLEENNILEISAWMILTNSATNEGDSGGPLVNGHGHLIGITQGGSTRAQAVSTFVDIREVKLILKEAKLNVPIASGKETAKKDDSGDSGDGGSDADTKTDTASNNTSRKPTSKSEDNKTEDKKVAGMVQRLVDADFTDRKALLEEFQTKPGIEYTEALATAIPLLSGSSRNKARQALAARLTRMTIKTLKGYFEDENPEIRRAAIRATVSKKDAKELMIDIVPLLTDKSSDVADEALEVLQQLSGETKIGKSPDQWKQFLKKK
jgi:S1-C subfamily serine protease